MFAIASNLIAVRLANDLGLNQSFAKALRGDRTAYIEARIYYLLYICDHHCSIPYGRPPMTSSNDAIKGADNFLLSTNAVEDDARLVSQVKLWSLIRSVTETCGSYWATSANELIANIFQHNSSLDLWLYQWSNRFSPHIKVGNYPKKGVFMHFQFARLFLCSYSFCCSATVTDQLYNELVDIRNTSVSAAISILSMVVEDTELCSFFNGLPLYFDVMIAFSAVFLLRIAKYSYYSATYTPDILLGMVRCAVSALQKPLKQMHSRHFLSLVVEGISKLLHDAKDSAGASVQSGDCLVDFTLSPPLHEVTPTDSSEPFDKVSSQFSLQTFDILALFDTQKTHGS